MKTKTIRTSFLNRLFKVSALRPPSSALCLLLPALAVLALALALAPAVRASQVTLNAGTTSWNVPAGVTTIQVEMWGAGGGGGGV